MKKFCTSLTIVILFIASVQAQWYFGPSMNYARHGLDVVDFEDRIFAIGGWNGGNILEVFENGLWSQLAPLPQSQQGLAAAIVGDNIYTFGSYGPSNITQIYNISTNYWSAGPNVPQELYWSTAEAVGDSIYLIAGYSPFGGGALNTLYILNTQTNTWTQGSNLPNGIQIPASCIYDNQIYVFGGYGYLYYKYDISTDTWTTFNGPPSGHGSAAEAVTFEDKIYLIGGNQGYIYEAYRTVEIYDPNTQEWIIGDSLNTGRYQFGATYVDGIIYSIGGRDENASSINSVEILEIDTTLIPVVITLSPANPPIVIPAIGGTVEFDIGVANNTPDPQTIDVWTVVNLTSVGSFEDILFLDFLLPGGAAPSRERSLEVPAIAPAGEYQYCAYIGEYPWIVWDDDSFIFTKEGTDSDWLSSLPYWNRYGESFDVKSMSPIESPSAYLLHSAYPNPFNPETVISFELRDASFVNLVIYDVQGREVARLVDGFQPAGMHQRTFNGSELSSGVYFACLKAGDFSQTRKMLLIK